MTTRGEVTLQMPWAGVYDFEAFDFFEAIRIMHGKSDDQVIDYMTNHLCLWDGWDESSDSDPKKMRLHALACTAWMIFCTRKGE
jgi:hypothetical protein